MAICDISKLLLVFPVDAMLMGAAFDGETVAQRTSSNGY